MGGQGVGVNGTSNASCRPALLLVGACKQFLSVHSFVNCRRPPPTAPPSTSREAASCSPSRQSWWRPPGGRCCTWTGMSHVSAAEFSSGGGKIREDHTSCSRRLREFARFGGEICFVNAFLESLPPNLPRLFTDKHRIDGMRYSEAQVWGRVGPGLCWMRAASLLPLARYGLACARLQTVVMCVGSGQKQYFPLLTRSALRLPA